MWKERELGLDGMYQCFLNFRRNVFKTLKRFVPYEAKEITVTSLLFSVDFKKTSRTAHLYIISLN